jgi:hypothetical protein
LKPLLQSRKRNRRLEFAAYNLSIFDALTLGFKPFQVLASQNMWQERLPFLLVPMEHGPQARLSKQAVASSSNNL